MPLLGYRFLNATNFISGPELRGKLLNLHFRESAAAAVQSHVLQNHSWKAAVSGNPIRKRLVRFRQEELRAVIGHSSHMGSKT